MEKDLDRKEIEKQVFRDLLIKSFRFPRFDTLQEYLRQRADVSDDELQEIQYQIGAMSSSERMQYVSWKEHVAERKKELLKSSLLKLLISDVNEKDIRLWIEIGELSEEYVADTQQKAEENEINKKT